MVKKLIVIALLCSMAFASYAFKPKKETTSVKEALGSVAQISQDLKEVKDIAIELNDIEGHLKSVEQISHDLKHVKGITVELNEIEGHLGKIEKSLAPVGMLAQPETIRGLILLLTACGAFLIVLHAVLRRWSTGQKT